MPPKPKPERATPADVNAGSRLGKYEIIKRLATGGMAEIFLARVSGLPGFQKMVVIKRILPQLATNDDFIEMFLDEARIAATLQHPNVVQMYDVGVVDGNYFIAMEYLHGEDVRSIQKTLWKRDEKLPLEHALNVMIGICSGLHYAHDKVGFDGKPLNIVHRDVTPQNVIVTYDGGVKLLDFGIAKASNRFGETRFGTLKGKVPYMSPEQCRGEPLDRRSDIFSLGIMLYELTVGRKLYRGKSDFEILKQIVEGTVARPTEIDAHYDKQLEKIVMRALEKERDKRYQTVREMLHDLEQLVRQSQIYLSPSSLQQFMEKVFGRKIEAWREAQALGKSLGEHLEGVEEVVVDDEDMVEVLDGENAEAELRAQEERAKWKAEIHAKQALSDEDDQATRSQPRPDSKLQPLSLDDAELAPRPSTAKWAIAAAAIGVLSIGAVAAMKLRKHEAKVVAEKVADSRQPTAGSPKPAPPTEPKVAPPDPKIAANEAAKAGDYKEDAKADAPVGIVEVRTSPAGATLYLDGRKLDGPSPQTVDRVEAGREHVLLAQLAGYQDAVEKFTVQANEVHRVSTHLHHAAIAGKHAKPTAATPAPSTPAPAPSPAVKLEGEGTLVIASSPWVSVSIDGKDRGQTPLSLKLPAGKHTVQLSNPEFKITRSLNVLILPNETLRKKLDFAQ